MSKKRQPPDVLTSEDVRWIAITRRTIDGLAAIAEAHAEGCDIAWCAMHYALEDLRDTVAEIEHDYVARIKEGGAE